MTQTAKCHWLARALAFATVCSRAAVWAGGALTLASVVLITYDVLVRKVFNVSIGGADELSGYAFAISTTWALAFATLQRANVRVDVVYERLPVRLAAVLDWLALVALAVFIVYLTRYGVEVFVTSWMQGSQANTPLATPLWIPQGLWALGLGWLCLVLALMLTRASWALVTGDLATLRAVCGVRSTKEEAQDEADAGARIIAGERS